MIWIDSIESQRALEGSPRRAPALARARDRTIAMGKSGAEAESPANRKQAERRRLAEALRANLSRRKARRRICERTEAGRDGTPSEDAASGDVAPREDDENVPMRSGDATLMGARHNIETGD